MDVMLQGHEAKRVFPVPDGLRELSSDITREVLRAQPHNIYGFVADYCEALLDTREYAVVAAEMVDQMIDHDVTFDALLERRGISKLQAKHATTIIQAAFRGYYTRRILKEHAITGDPFLLKLGIEEELANRATTIIQAAFRGYFTRKTLQALSLLRSAVVGDQIDHTSIISAVLTRSGLSLEEVNKAASRIQRIFRRYSIRKSTQELGSGEPTEESQRRQTGSSTGPGIHFIDDENIVEPSDEPEGVDATEVIEASPTDNAESVVESTQQTTEESKIVTEDEHKEDDKKAEELPEQETAEINAEPAALTETNEEKGEVSADEGQQPSTKEPRQNLD